MQQQQHTLQWHRDRLGRITGSRVGDIMTAPRAKGATLSKTAEAYLMSVAAECMIPPYITNDDDLFTTYLNEVNVSSKAMRIGNEREDEARDLYAEVTGVVVEQVGCMPHPAIDGFASSPDGIIRRADGSIAGVLEIKCPKPDTFMQYLRSSRDADALKTINATYYWQCQAHMAVTGADFCDFCVYSPYLSRPLVKIHLQRDAEIIDALEQRVRHAIDYIGTIVSEALCPV